MNPADGLDRAARVRLDWRVAPERVRAIRSREIFACNARFPDRQPVPGFSIVLTWPTDDIADARLTLLVQIEENRPIVNRFQPGQSLDVTEGPIRVIAEATIIGIE